MKHPKFVAFPFIILAIVAILSAGPTKAKIATTVSVTHVSIGNNSRVEVTPLCPYTFNFGQRMTISGRSTMVLAASQYRPGYYELTLNATCEGYNIYDVDPCGCLTEFPEATSEDTEEVTTDFYKPTQAAQFTVESNATGVLWIKKEKPSKN